MALPHGRELDLQPPEPTAAALASPETAEIATPVMNADLKNRPEGQTDGNVQPPANDDDVPGGDDKATEPALAQARSHDTSASGAPTTDAITHEQKLWYKNWNPLRWGAVTPVPKERVISPEARAGVWSKLIFSWVGPIMVVSPRSPVPLQGCHRPLRSSLSRQI